MWEEIRAFASSDRTVVISSESFETLDPQHVRAQVQGHHVRVVAYVRPATSRLPSLYGQNTKYGFNLADFDTFFARMEPDKRTRWLPSALARRWAAAFGGENVRIRVLNPDVLTGGSLESDFLELVGVPGTLGSTIADDDSDNVSPAWKTLESLRVIHGFAFAGRPPRDIRNDRDSWKFARLTLREAGEVAEQLGWTDRGRYLSLAQQTMLVDVHNHEVELLDQVALDAEDSSDRGRHESDTGLPADRVGHPRGRTPGIHPAVAPRLLQKLASKATSSG